MGKLESEAIFLSISDRLDIGVIVKKQCKVTKKMGKFAHPSTIAGAMNERKIIHIDMDAFYASVEQRDNPELRGRPVAVGHAERRGVVAAASYEARRYGVRSAMSSQKAKRICPELIFVHGRMDVYKSVSQSIHDIFHEYTDIIEPISLDEAFLDVTVNKPGMRTGCRHCPRDKAQNSRAS